MRATLPLVFVCAVAVAGVAAAEESTEFGAGPLYVHIDGDDPFPTVRHEGGEGDGIGDDTVWAHQDFHHVGVHVDGDYLQRHGVPVTIPTYRHEIDAETMVLAEHPVGPALKQVSHAWANVVPSQVRHYVDFRIDETGLKTHLSEDFWPLSTNDSAPPYSIWWYTWVDYDRIHMPQGVPIISDDALWLFDQTMRICWLPTTVRICPTEILPFLGDVDQWWYDHMPNVVTGYHFINGEFSTEPFGDDGPSETAPVVEAASAPLDLSAGVPGAMEASRAPIAASTPPVLNQDSLPRAARVGGHASVSEAPATPEAVAPQNSWPILALAALAALAVPLWALYRRVRKEDALEHETRRRIYETVVEEPGLNENELARRIGVHHDTVAHHVRLLHQYGYVEVRNVGRTRHLFKNGGRFNDGERTAHAVLQSPQKERILRILIREPGLSQEAVRARIGIAKATINWHVQGLVTAGIVREERLSRGKRLFVHQQMKEPVTDALFDRRKRAPQASFPPQTLEPFA